MKALALVVGAEREELLELVDDEHDDVAVARAWQLRHGVRQPALGRRRAASRWVAAASAAQRQLELIEGVGAGDHPTSRTSAADPGSAPARRRGTRPARTTDDLPDPDGPRTTRHRHGGGSPASRSSIRSTRRSRPKKSSASASWNARSPLYGLRGAARSRPAPAVTGRPSSAATQLGRRTRRPTGSERRDPWPSPARARRRRRTVTPAPDRRPAGGHRGAGSARARRGVRADENGRAPLSTSKATMPRL